MEEHSHIKAIGEKYIRWALGQDTIIHCTRGNYEKAKKSEKEK